MRGISWNNIYLYTYRYTSCIYSRTYAYTSYFTKNVLFFFALLVSYLLPYCKWRDIVKNRRNKQNEWNREHHWNQCWNAFQLSVYIFSFECSCQKPKINIKHIGAMRITKFEMGIGAVKRLCKHSNMYILQNDTINVHKTWRNEYYILNYNHLKIYCILWVLVDILIKINKLE